MKLAEYKPKGDYIVVEQMIPSQTAGGLYIPHGVNVGFVPCKVLKVGPGCKDSYEGEVVIINNFNVLAFPLDFSDQKRKEIFTTRETNVIGGVPPNQE